MPKCYFLDRCTKYNAAGVSIQRAPHTIRRQKKSASTLAITTTGWCNIAPNLAAVKVE